MVGKEVQSSLGVLGQSGLETSTCALSRLFKAFLEPACYSALATSSGSIILCFVLCLVYCGHCPPWWTLHTGSCFDSGQPFSLFRSGKPASQAPRHEIGICLLCYQLQRSWKLILQNSLWAVFRKYLLPTLPPQIRRDSYLGEDLSTAISSFISLTTASMLGIRK